MIVAIVLGWLAPTPKFPPSRPALARSRPPTAQLPNLFGKKEVVLEAGHALYIPKGMWHQVLSNADTLAFSLQLDASAR